MKQLSRWRLNTVHIQLRRIATIYLIKVAVIYSLIGTIYVEADFKGCNFGVESPGWTTPAGDVTLEVGNSLEIFCSLNDSYIYAKEFSSENIVFYNGTALIDRSLVTVINATTARLHIDNVTLSKSMFYCKLSRNNLDSSNSIKKSASSDRRDVPDLLVCLNTVQIGTKPKDVTNFTIISDNWKSLNISWIRPNNGVPTNYSVYYLTPKRSSRGKRYLCPTDDDIRQGKCVWTMETDPSYRNNFATLTFIINGVNRFGNSSQQFVVSHFAHVKTQPPQDLKVLAKTVSSIYMSWDVGELYIIGRGLSFKIEYMWSSVWNTLSYDENNLTSEKHLFKINITNLPYPNTVYNFRVYMRPAAAISDEYWSKPAAITVKTKACPPYTSPETDIGSFEVVNETNTFRDVLIYWKALPKDQFNGDNFRYEFTVWEDDVPVSIQPNRVMNSYAEFASLTFNSYRFSITSVNAEGPAKYSTAIYVPRKSQMIPEPIVFTKIDFGDGIYQLSWKPPDVAQHSITNFTTFWCESDKDRPYQCNGPLNWTHLSSDTVRRNFTNNSTDGYQFAISVNSDTSSSGMVWASCTALHNKLTKMQHVWIGKIEPYSIEVKWKLVCSERIDGIKGYFVYYCVTSPADNTKCVEPERNVKGFGDVTTMRVNVTDLKPFTNYKIQVAVFVNDNITGPRSDEMYNRTSEGPPDTKGLTVQVTNITNNSAQLYWQAPQITNGILRNYTVQYNDKQMQTNDTRATLKDLQSYTTYNIIVSACTLLCAEMKSETFSTKIGIPGTVSKPTIEKFNSSHVLVSWQPPSVAAGPNPMYDVRVQFDDSDQNSTISEFEVAYTNTTVAIPNCLNEAAGTSYKIFLRAKNVDYTDPSHPQYFIGDWSPAHSFGCGQYGKPTFWKILLFISLLVLGASSLIFWAKKGFYRCQQMQHLDVTLPPKFIDPPIFHNDSKQQDYQINIGSWPGDLTECDHLNCKITDIDQSSIDCIDIDLDTDRETDRSSSGCYTG